MRFMVILAIALGLQPVKTHWAVSYSHKDPRSSLILSNIRFADAAHGVAVGRLGKPGRPSRGDLTEPVALTTADGGASWNLLRLKSHAWSLFFLDAENCWMTAADGLWKSIDGGKSFKKISGRRLGRVHFLDSRHGFATGTGSRTAFVAPETFPLESNPPPWGSPPRLSLDATRVPTEQLQESRDGGVTWKVHPASKQLGSATVRSIDFEGKRGAAMGVLPRSGAVQPDGSYSTVTVIAETGDGGDTWTVSRLTLPGLAHDYQLAPGGGGYALTPELYRIEAEPTRATRVFARPDLGVTDLAVQGDGSAWVAAVARPPAGTWVATEVRMLHSAPGGGFTETAIESAVKARFVAITKAPGGGMWAATDTGIILNLK